jgi:hypothetical protein
VAELALWKQADIDIAADKGAGARNRPGHERGPQHGLGVDAYLLGSRNLACVQEPRRPHHPCQGDKRLFNQCGVILVNPAKHPTVKTELGQQFIDWLISPEGRRQSPATRSTTSSFSSERQRPKRLTSTAVAPGCNRRLLPKTPSVHGTNPAFDAGRTNFRLLE